VALSVKCGSFSTRTSTGSQAYTGVGFQPKALILWCVGATSAGSFQAHAQVFYGIASGSSAQYCVGGYSEDALADSDAKRFWQNVVLSFCNVSSTLTVEASLTSFDSDGFTLNYTTASATAYVVHYMALGGSDVTNAAVVNWTCPTSGGNKAVTGVGFQPDCVLHLFSNQSAALANPPTYSGNFKVSVSAMDSGGRQWANTINSLNSQPTMDTQRGQLTNRCLLDIASSLAFNYEASYVSMDADGFTTNFATVTGTAHNVVSLCLKGGQYYVGSFNQPTSAAPQDSVISSPGFTATGYLLSTFCRETSASGLANSRLGVGGSDGTAEESVVFGDDNGAANSSVDCQSNSTKVLQVLNNNTPAVDAEADHKQFTASGFDLTWTTTYGTATECLYMAFGSSPATGHPAMSRARGIPGMACRPVFGGRW
jgi:hypothetical protein